MTQAKATPSPSLRGETDNPMCECGHKESEHRYRDDDGVLRMGECDKLDWGMSKVCTCKGFKPSHQREGDTGK